MLKSLDPKPEHSISSLAVRLAMIILLSGVSWGKSFAADLPLIGSDRPAVSGSAFVFPLSKDEFQTSRSAARAASPVATHAYDRAGAMNYLSMLNRQFVSLEAIARLLRDYELLKKKLASYNQFLDACISVQEKNIRNAFDRLCASELAGDSYARSAYYNFVDRVGYLNEASKLEIVRAAMKPLLVDLAKAADVAGLKEQKIAKLR